MLFTGYLWLLQVGTGKGAEARGGWGSRLTSFLYGSGSALTLDEFAMWLNLKNDYWANEGRESIDAVVLFGATLTVGALGGPFFRTLANSWNALKR